MTRNIRRDDPAYDAAMREAKAQFDDAMARSVMRQRGRPSKPVEAPAAEAPEDVPTTEE
jgi:hypothetical protein